MILRQARALVVLAVIAWVGLLTLVPTVVPAAYGYDESALVIAAVRGVLGTSTTGIAKSSITTSTPRSGSRTLPGAVRCGSGFVCATKPAAGVVDDVGQSLVGGNRRIQALRNIGQQGAGQSVREVPGGLARAEEIYAGLARGAQPFRTLPNGRQLLQRSDGTIIGLRPTSRSGPPSIDVRPPGGNDQYFQLHFPGG